jgi:hypothetical protein
MRSSTRRALTLGAFAATAFAWSGCEAKKQTEYVAGVSTQVQVPRDLKAIRLDVTVGGVVQFCRAYRVYDGKVQLPRSLGEFPSTGEPGRDPITVTVSGFTEEFSETAARDVFDNCTSIAPKVGGDKIPCSDDASCGNGGRCIDKKCEGTGTRIIRRSRQPYVKDKILFLPMPLKYSCFDTQGCEDETKTCKAGRCVDAVVDETKLPVFTEDLLDGSGGACFPASQCFAAGAPAVIVNPEDCTYALPNSPPSSPPQVEGAPPNPFPKSGDGINVEVTYDAGTNREILDNDPEEGFIFPDIVGKPQQFRLAPGLCDLVKGFRPGATPGSEGSETAHRITAIRVSGTCAAKSPFQPLCAGDQLAAMGLDENGVVGTVSPAGCQPTELKPPKAALIVLTDDSKNSELFYSQAASQGVALSLSDPAFQKTDLALGFFPGPSTPATCMTAGSFGLAVQPGLARRVKNDIITAISSHSAALTPRNAPVNLDGALRDAYEFFNTAKEKDPVTGVEGLKFASYYRRGVLVIGNRNFDPATEAPPKATCGMTAIQRAAAAHNAAKKIETYVLMLANSRESDDPNVPGSNAFVPGSNELAVAGGTERVFDARSSKVVAQDAFQAVVNDLATCAYDVTGTTPRPKQGDILSYTDPIDPAAPTVNLAFNPTCSVEQSAGEGFGVDPVNASRVYFCKASCDKYRAVLRTAALYAAQNLQPAIPVPVFSHKQGCSPVPGKTSAGSNPPPAP